MNVDITFVFLWVWRIGVVLALGFLWSITSVGLRRMAQLEKDSLSVQDANDRRNNFRIEMDAKMEQLSKIIEMMATGIEKYDREATDYRHRTNNTVHAMKLELEMLKRR